MYPLLLHSPCRANVWGGDRIEKIFGAEEYRGASQVWLLSAGNEGESVVKNGDYKDKTLGEITETLGRAFCGAKFDPEKPFPLFIRLFDARDSLPLTVCTAERLLYVAKAEPEARVIYGFSHHMSADELSRRVSSNALYSACNIVPARTGDLIKIPAGLLFAAGQGVLCYEVSLTDGERYILSDYGRSDREGKRSPVDVKGALEHIFTGPSGQDIVSDDTFLYPFGTVSEVNLHGAAHVSLIRLAGSVGIFESESFMSVIVTEGEVTFSSPSANMRLKAGDSILIPADTRAKFSGYGNLLYTHL